MGWSEWVNDVELATHMNGARDELRDEWFSLTRHWRRYCTPRVPFLFICAWYLWHLTVSKMFFFYLCESISSCGALMAAMYVQLRTCRHHCLVSTNSFKPWSAYYPNRNLVFRIKISGRATWGDHSGALNCDTRLDEDHTIKKIVTDLVLIIN